MSLGHWPIVAGAALAAWLIGALWYSPLLFAKAWSKAHGYSHEKLAEMQKTAWRTTYAVSLVAYVVMAYVRRLFLSQLGAGTLASGAMCGFHAWVGIALPIGFTPTSIRTSRLPPSTSTPATSSWTWS